MTKGWKVGLIISGIVVFILLLILFLGVFNENNYYSGPATFEDKSLDNESLVILCEFSCDAVKELIQSENVSLGLLKKSAYCLKSFKINGEIYKCHTGDGQGVYEDCMIGEVNVCNYVGNVSLLVKFKYFFE